MGSRGDRQAAALLCALYRFCRYASAHQEELLAALADYTYKKVYAEQFSPEAVKLDQDKTEVLQKLLHLRKEMKSGSIDNLEYQRSLRPLKQEMKRLEFDSEVDLDAIFKDCFRSHIEPAVWKLRRETVISYLEMMRNGRARQ